MQFLNRLAAPLPASWTNTNGEWAPFTPLDPIHPLAFINSFKRNSSCCCCFYFCHCCCCFQNVSKMLEMFRHISGLNINTTASKIIIIIRMLLLLSSLLMLLLLPESIE